MPNVLLPGSERSVAPGARAVGAADPQERFEVSVIVRRANGGTLNSRVAALASGDRAARPMTRSEFAQQHGAAAADLAAVQAFARAQGLTVVGEHAARRTVRLAGSVAQFEAAFAVRLQRFAHAGGSYRGRTGAIQIPGELQDVVEAVLGLDDRPQARPHCRLRKPSAAGGSAADESFTPIEVATLYGYPPGTGQGECVGLVELGGGFRPADLQTYFAGLGVGPVSVSAVSVDGAANAPTGSADGPDGEVMLDIEVVGAIAPAARIVAYFAPNTDAGFLDAVTTAIHDTTNAPSVISISWGGAESTWTSQALTAMSSAFEAAAAMGVTICVASGDNGSSDGVSGGGKHVDFPASSPFALACGGTSLKASSQAITSETVWNDGSAGGASGGGISSFFATPAWQAHLSARSSTGTTVPLSMRGVPDVAGDADPQTGYDVRIDGSDTVIGGTSAVAPLWAALIARINEINGKPAGFVNPALYANPKGFRDITQGNNGAFEATVGWDACTGLGTPDGPQLAPLVKRMSP
jgi:kumamolisin